MRRLWQAAILGVLASALTSVTVPTRAADSYAFTTIDVPGAIATEAHGINSAGQIVGEFGGGHGHGFVRTAAGAFATIDVPGAIGTSADGINDAGQIVGVYWKTLNLEWGGLVRTAEGVLTTFDVPGASLTAAKGINGAGQIVGWFFDGRLGYGFLRATSGVFTTIAVPRATETRAEGVNDTGLIVGIFFDSHGTTHGFLPLSHRRPHYCRCSAREEHRRRGHQQYRADGGKLQGPSGKVPRFRPRRERQLYYSRRPKGNRHPRLRHQRRRADRRVVYGCAWNARLPGDATTCGGRLAATQDRGPVGPGGDEMRRLWRAFVLSLAGGTGSASQ